MEAKIYMKSVNEPVIIKGDRIDILDFENKGIKYKQIRYFRKGFSKSIYIEKDDLKNIERK